MLHFLSGTLHILLLIIIILLIRGGHLQNLIIRGILNKYHIA